MATVTYHIRSHYDPEDREKLEIETGQIEESDASLKSVVDPEEEWKKEASKLPSQRPRRAAPQFVPATANYDEWGTVQASSSKLVEDNPRKSLGNSLSGWYRSLTNTQASASAAVLSSAKDNSEPTARPSPLTSEHHVLAPTDPEPRKSEVCDKNNWFIMNAIQSEPSSSSSTPAPSLADILARDPPPLPSQSKFTPPVFLEIGPSNKGFGMLQRSGWNEGEALGPDVIRRKPVNDILPDEDILPSVPSIKGKGKSRLTTTVPSTDKRRVVEVKMEGFDDVSELREVDVIDLTLSDSDASDEADEDDAPEDDLEDVSVKYEEGTSGAEMCIPPIDDSTYGRKALLTPIATVLKSDKLGIGLKAKTAGPYKESQKRVTHSAAALAAHVKAAEESRLRKKRFGRGRRGFEKQHRKEEEHRKAMLSYLKGGL